MSSADAPAFFGIIGPPGSGKTTDLVRGCGASSLIACSAGSLKPVRGVLNLPPERMPPEHKANTLDEAIVALRLMSKMPLAKRPKFYLADEMSWMASNTLAEIEAKNTGWTVWSKLKNKANEFRDVARDSSINVGVNGWETPATNKPGKGKIRGGMLLPADMPEYFPGLLDYFMRAVYDMTRPGHPWVYVTRGNDEWSMKDRDNKTPNPAPMNLGEILRFAGYDTPRWFPWHNDLYPIYRQGLTALVAQGVQPMQAAEMMYQATVQKHPNAHPSHVKWLIQDVLDGHFLSTMYANRWATFA